MPRPACPVTPRTVPPAHLLERVADQLISAHPSGARPALVRLRTVRDQVELALQPLPADVAPADALLGMVVPRRWSAAGVVAGGTAHHLERAVHHAVTLVVLVDRSGHCAHRVTDDTGAVVVSSDERPGGRLLDLLLRSLAQPTPPPEHGPRRWWVAAWLDAIVACVAEAPGALSSFDDALALHPLAERRSGIDGAQAATVLDGEVLASGWPDLRHALSDEPPPARPALGAARAALHGHLDAAVAQWMDDGCLERWLLGELPPVHQLLAAAETLLPVVLAEQVRAHVVASLGVADQPPDLA